MNYAIKDAMDVFLQKRVVNADGVEVFENVLFTDYANETSIEFTAERLYAKAKGNDKIAFDYGKKSTLKMSMEVFDLSWLAILLGAETEVGAVDFTRREVLTIVDGKVTIKDKPMDGSVAIYKVGRDLKSHESGKMDASKFTVAGNEITITGLNGSVPTVKSTPVLKNGDKIVVYYLTKSALTAKTMTISANKFPTNYAITGVTSLRNEFGEDIPVQFFIPSCKPQSNFTFTMSAESCATVDATFDVFPDASNSMMELRYIED